MKCEDCKFFKERQSTVAPNVMGLCTWAEVHFPPPLLDEIFHLRFPKVVNTRAAWDHCKVGEAK